MCPACSGHLDLVVVSSHWHEIQHIVFTYIAATQSNSIHIDMAL